MGEGIKNKIIGGKLQFKVSSWERILSDKYFEFLAFCILLGLLVLIEAKETEDAGNCNSVLHG